MSAIKTSIGSLQDSKLGQGCSVKKAPMSNSEVDGSIGCSDAFKETIMNLKALNGEGDMVKNNSDRSDTHGSKNLAEQKGLSKMVETLESPVINTSSSENTRSCFVKESSVNGKIKKSCIMGGKERTTDEIIDDIDDELSAGSKQFDTDMEVDDCPGQVKSCSSDCVNDAKERTTDEIIDDIDDELSAGPKHLDINMKNSTGHKKRCVTGVTTGGINNIKQIMTSSEQNVLKTNFSMDNEDCLESESSDVSNDILCANSVSSKNDSNTLGNSLGDNSMDVVSTNHEYVESVDGSRINHESSVLDKSKTKHSNDVNIPFNPLTIGDKVRNSVRDIMSKLKQGKTPELTRFCSKTKSEDSVEAEASVDSCDSVTSLETCDTVHKTDTKPSPRKDNLFESMSLSSLSVIPKLDLKMLDKPASVDVVDSESELKTNDELDSDKSEMNQSVNFELKLDSSDSEEETKSEITDKSEAEEKKEISEITSDTSKESHLDVTKSEGMFSDGNFDSFPNSIQSDTCLIDESEVDKAIALIDGTDAAGSPSTSSVSNTDLMPFSPSNDVSQSSESQQSTEKMETSENTIDYNNDVKPSELVSDELKENSEECDSGNLEDSSKQDETLSVIEDSEEPDDNTLELASVNTSASNERKRSQDDKPDDSEQPSKRSRLDEVIGKLGSVIGIPPETVEQVDSDSDSEESPHSESSEVKSEVEDVTSVSDEDDDKTSQATSQSSTKTVRLSSKELEALVRTKVQKYLSAYRDEEKEQLQKRVSDLQAANERWKTQARDLQKKVVDLTVLQQKLEKRKAATAALKQITSKCVGVQVSMEEPKQTVSTIAQRLTKTTTKSTATVPSSMVFTPSLLSPQPTQNTMTQASAVKPNTPAVTLTSSAIAARNSVTQLLTATAMPRVCTSITTGSSFPVPSSVGVRPQLTQHLNAANTVRSLLDSARVGEAVRFQGVPNSVGSSLLVLPVAQNAPKVIDLTADDESQPKPGQLVQAVQVLPGTNTSQLRPATLHQIPQQVLRQAAPLPRQTGPMTQTIPGTSILLSSPAGTQILNNTGTLNRPGGTFQVVTIASGSNIRPGTLLTVVPATSTQLSSVRPQGVGVSVAKQVSPQAMPQLRAAQPTQLTYTTSVRPSLQVQSIRPPPPLMSAPAPAPATQSIVRVSAPPTSTTTARSATNVTPRHPAPLPAAPIQKSMAGKPLPPKPSLKISRVSQGIVLSWNVTSTDNISDINSYQLFAYQETSSPPITALWKKVGDVKALPLPMACTLTQFQDGNKYHFAVRAIDQTGRFGEFSEPSTIHLTPKA